MRRIEFNQNWKITYELAFDASYGLPDSAETVDLPVDLLCDLPRNDALHAGKYNGYHDSVSVVLCKLLPPQKKSDKLYLDLWGVQVSADVYCNGVYLKTVQSTVHHWIDLTPAIQTNGNNRICLVIASPAETGRYTGAGISGGAALVVCESAVTLENDSVFVCTQEVSAFAQLSVSTVVSNESDETKQLLMEVVLQNVRGKRVSRKARKIKILGGKSKAFELPVRLKKYFCYCPEDPYIYNCTVTLYDGETIVDSQSAPFGIVSRQVGSRGLVLNGKPVKLMGAVVAHDNGILGNRSFYEAEYYKLSRIRALGYNAVRYEGIPSDAALSALSVLGLYTVVDLFTVWSQGTFPYDGHRQFAQTHIAVLQSAIKTLRKYPCVVGYCLGSGLKEAYGRADGANLCRELCAEVKKLDATRFVTIGAAEHMPTRAELESVGVKTPKSETEFLQNACRLAQEKDLFGVLTRDVFVAVDVAGYCNLHTRYAADRMRLGRPILGLSTSVQNAFDAWEEVQKLPQVIGDFKAYAADCLGSMPTNAFSGAVTDSEWSHLSDLGDLDLTYYPKQNAFYREILAGRRSVSLITVVATDALIDADKSLESAHSGVETQKDNQSDINPFRIQQAEKDKSANCILGVSQWNYPDRLGQTLQIDVLSGGDVVALYLNDRLIGRKLAGKQNRHIASFMCAYVPGRLEAVSFYRGTECSRTTLETVSSPKTIRLECAQKFVSEGECAFVEISVRDKEGRIVPYAAQQVTLTIKGEGALVALGSADPQTRPRPRADVVAVYNGRALGCVRGLKEGKMQLEAVGEGLRAGKLNLRIKQKSMQNDVFGRKPIPPRG